MSESKGEQAKGEGSDEFDARLQELEALMLQHIDHMIQRHLEHVEYLRNWRFEITSRERNAEAKKDGE